MNPILILLVIANLLCVSVGIAESEVIIIGGWGKELPELKALQQNIPDSDVFLIGRPINPVAVADELRDYLQSKEVKKVSLVGFSYGGIIARQFAASYPDSVKELVIIATPNGGVKMPRWLKDYMFNIKGVESNAPLYLIIGTKNRNKWYLDDDNDGFVGLESSLAITRDRPINGARILPLEHDELISSKIVAAQIIEWLHLNDRAAVALSPSDK